MRLLGTPTPSVPDPTAILSPTWHPGSAQGHSGGMKSCLWKGQGMACPAERQVAKQEFGGGCGVAVGLQEGLCPMAGS